MGFAYGLGGMMSPIVGKLADLYSIEQTLFGVALLPLLTLALILNFPAIGGRQIASNTFASNENVK